MSWIKCVISSPTWAVSEASLYFVSLSHTGFSRSHRRWVGTGSGINSCPVTTCPGTLALPPVTPLAISWEKLIWFNWYKTIKNLKTMKDMFCYRFRIRVQDPKLTLTNSLAGYTPPMVFSNTVRVIDLTPWCYWLTVLKELMFFNWLYALWVSHVVDMFYFSLVPLDPYRRVLRKKVKTHCWFHKEYTTLPIILAKAHTLKASFAS